MSGPRGTTIRGWKTHFQMKTPANVATEMALHVLAYNLKRVIAGEFRHVALPHPGAWHLVGVTEKHTTSGRALGTPGAALSFRRNFARAALAERRLRE
jgi:hypothetical protein